MQMFGVDSFSLYLRVRMGCRSYDTLQLACRHTEQVLYILYFRTCVSTFVDWGFRETNRIRSNRVRLIKMLQRLNCRIVASLDSIPLYTVSQSYTGNVCQRMVLICRVSVMQPQFYVIRFNFVSVPAAFWNCPISLKQNMIHSKSAIIECIKMHYLLSFFLCRDLCLPTYCRCRGYCCTWSHNDTHTHTHISVELLWTRDRPVAEISTWQHTTVTRGRLHAPGGIRTRTPSSWAAADPRFRLRGHRKWKV